MLSVVIPAYNEADMILKTADTISDILQKAEISYELLFVDDGSKDATWEKILQASAKTAEVRGISFSRNFGKEAAIFAGLSEAKGDCCAVIDCDLQHPPEKLVEMYRLWQQGYEVIEGVKKDRGTESVWHGLAAKCFYALISHSVKIDMSNASDFKLLDRKAVNVLLTMREKHAFFRALSSWIGFRTIQVEYEVQERQAGTSKWSAGSLFKYAITSLTSFSSLPLKVIVLTGVLVFLLSVVLGCIVLYQKFAGLALDGFTTVIIVLLFIGSMIMVSLGCIGYYVSKIYEEVKGRPRYIVSKTCGIREK